MADVSAKNVVSRAVWRGVAWCGLVLVLRVVRKRRQDEEERSGV